jgi:hypothetical protein
MELHNVVSREEGRRPLPLIRGKKRDLGVLSASLRPLDLGTEYVLVLFYFFLSGGGVEVGSFWAVRNRNTS